MSIEPSPLTNQFHRYYTRLQPILTKPKTRATTSAVFSFLAISLFVLYAIRPTAQTIIFLRREIIDKTALNAKMEEKITTLIEAQSTYESVADSVPAVDQALPENPDALYLARQLRNLIGTTGATISAMQIPGVPFIAQEATPGSKLAPATPLTEFPVNIVLSGSYPSLKSFLDGLLSMRRIINIESLSFKQSGKFGALGDTLQLSARLKSYYSSQ